MTTLDDIVDHARCQSWRGPVFDGAVTVLTRNPLCGDIVSLHVDLRDGDIWQARHESVGCIISRGCTSLLCEQVEGKPVAEVLQSGVEGLLEFDISQLTIHKQQCARLAYDLLQRMLREQFPTEANEKDSPND
ncbi:MAG: iron-sulfur cluster assembly scaffold protein [Planctomycetaceae bacterium]|nr:iron-sulfur cluster assembly scaffold protein [Planctomycetaceae bacterium]MCB9953639.1 iron-sulfur cluster assembly scaffold protein [Planctomycetaceae bacterium]